jgi:hypothetical protein
LQEVTLNMASSVKSSNDSHPTHHDLWRFAIAHSRMCRSVGPRGWDDFSTGLAGGELDAVLLHMTDIRLAQRVFDNFFPDDGRAGITKR